jgi:FtsP/CotA-like multicopper oxidase with cupredoxin domain
MKACRSASNKRDCNQANGGTKKGPCSSPCSIERFGAFAAIFLLFMGFGLCVPTTQAQGPQVVPCAPLGQELIKIPAVGRDDPSDQLKAEPSKAELIRVELTLTDNDKRIMWDSGATPRCATQYMRFFTGTNLLKPGPPSPIFAGSDPVPGPTLRARVGDRVEITFRNQINTQHFPNSLDRGEHGDTDGCDVRMGTPPKVDWKANTNYRPNARINPSKNNPGASYFTATQDKAAKSGATPPNFPQTKGQTVTDGGVTWTNVGTSIQTYPGGDTMPNCLHGSSTANVHFHGTHTTPNTTGDNVLLFVRPALRIGGEIQPTNAFVDSEFKEFFNGCKEDGPPTKWEQMPLGWQQRQKDLLELYDKTAPYKGQNGKLPENMHLWPVNKREIAHGLWPQYQLGAFPYCFNLPDYDSGKVKMGQAPGTHWYHAHKHGSTALNVANGMTGAFIIEGKYDDELRAFYKSTPGWKFDEKVLVIQQLATVLNLGSPLATGPGSLSVPLLSVNGQRQPVVKMKRNQVQLWRFVNGAERDATNFLYFARQGESCTSTPAQCATWRQTAQDGVQLKYENYEAKGDSKSFLLAPGNRADLLVKAPDAPGKYDLKVQAGLCFFNGCNPQEEILVTAEVEDQERIEPPMPFVDKANYPTFPRFLDDIPASSAYVKRDLVFEDNRGKLQINGKQFVDNVINQAMLLNSVEEWKVSNKDNDREHPFHIHVNPFQIFEVFAPQSGEYNFTDPNKPCYVDPDNPATWKPCHVPKENFVWWDTFAIPAAKVVEDKNGQDVTIPGYFKMRSKFVDFPGQFVLHCHILTHEDRGMMELIEVVPDTTMYTHH